MGIYLGSNALGGGGGSGLLNQVYFKSSGTWDPTDPYGDNSNLALEADQLVHFFMVGGGQAGRSENSIFSVVSGYGGRLWIGTLRLADETNSVTITIGAGGTGSLGAGSATTAVQAGSHANKIDISTATSDSRSTFGGQRTAWNGYSSNFSSGSGSMGFPPYSMGGGLSDSGYNGSRGANTGDGGWGRYRSSDGSGGAGGSGILIVSW